MSTPPFSVGGSHVVDDEDNDEVLLPKITLARLDEDEDGNNLSLSDHESVSLSASVDEDGDGMSSVHDQPVSADEDSDDIPLARMFGLPLLNPFVHPSGRAFTVYEENFMRGLGFRNPAKFRYAGGDTGKHRRWFKRAHPELPEPAHATECLCTHPIKKNMWIYHISDPTTLLTTGSHCINRFKIPGKSCPICHEPHSARSDVWCNKCRGGKFSSRSNRGKTYRRVMVEDMAYCRRAIIDNLRATVDDRNFVAWLKLQPELADFIAERKAAAEVERIRIADAKRRRETEKARAAHLLAGRTRLGFDKRHQTKTYEEMYKTQRGFCDWTLTKSSACAPMARFQAWLRAGEKLRDVDENNGN